MMQMHDKAICLGCWHVICMTGISMCVQYVSPSGGVIIVATANRDPGDVQGPETSLNVLLILS